MYIYLSKILPLFVMPLGVALFLTLVALILVLTSYRKTAAGFIALAFVVLWAGSTPIVAHQLYLNLESRYPARPFNTIPRVDCIVLLGGAVGPPLPPRLEIEFNEAIDRVYKTAELYRKNKARTVIVTAGNQPWSESRWAEAELIRDLLVDWGVSKESIMLEASSRNTHENAVYSRNIIDAIGCVDTVLVTSAAHMPRAVAAFRSVKVEVIPVPVDFRVVKQTRISVMSFLPDAQALAMTSEAIREWIGRVVYGWKGWN